MSTCGLFRPASDCEVGSEPLRVHEARIAPLEPTLTADVELRVARALINGDPEAGAAVRRAAAKALDNGAIVTAHVTVPSCHARVPLSLLSSSSSRPLQMDHRPAYESSALITLKAFSIGALHGRTASEQGRRGTV